MTSVGEWAARRQADVLLYVGAFLLVISALIFVSSQDEALAGGWRVAILAVYTVAFMVAGWLLQRWPRVREAGPAFLAIGALMSPLNFLLLHNEVLSDREVAGELVWFLASIYSAAFYGLLFAGGAGRLYAVPAVAAVLSAWGSLAVMVGIPVEWGGAWWMAFALVGADAISAARRWSAAAAALVAVAASLAALFSVAVALFADQHEWQLPVTLGLLLLTVGLAGIARREPAAAVVAAALAAIAAIAGLWAAGVEAEWYSLPPLAVGALLLVGRPGWVASSPQLGLGALVLTVAAAASPFVIVGAHIEGDSSIAVAAFMGSAALFAAAGWLNTAEGIAPWTGEGKGPTMRLRPTPPAERVVFGWLAFVAALVAVGFAQRAQGVSPPDTGWVLAAIALGSATVTVLTVRARPALLWATAPPSLLATVVALHPIEQHTGHDAVFLALGAAHALIAFAVLRRWSLSVVAVALAMAALAALWEVQAWPWWVLAAAYAATGTVLFVLATPLRWYGQPDGSEAEAFWGAHALSWLPLGAAVGVAAAALGDRVEGTAIEPATVVEFRVLAVLFLPLAAAVAFEGYRLGVRWAVLPASALAMVALELGIATLEPGNVQAHTVPAAVYLALVGLTMRPAERFSDHLGWHEVLQVAAAGLLVIPQAEQGFEPGGARWGLVLLVEGVALLAVALALNTRWLAVSAVVTLSGVALRFLWVNRDTDLVPYWAMLAVAGFVLLGVGVSVLMQREWWDRSRARLLHRWRQEPVLYARTADEAPVAALLSALAPVLAIIAVTAGE